MGMGLRWDLAIEEIRNLSVGPNLPRSPCSCDAEGDGGPWWDWAITVGIGHDGELQEEARGLRRRRRGLYWRGLTGPLPLLFSPALSVLLCLGTHEW
jgi:hypothetical protein